MVRVFRNVTLAVCHKEKLCDLCDLCVHTFLAETNILNAEVGQKVIVLLMSKHISTYIFNLTRKRIVSEKENVRFR